MVNHRALYEKGWYYEKKAIELFRKKGVNWFFVKSPYSYPFDIIAFQPYTNTINLIEVKYTNGKRIILYGKKLKRAIAFAKKHKNFIFNYIVVCFFGSKYNYKTLEFTNMLNTLKTKDIIIDQAEYKIE